ncbi:hypothetical protein AA313_de0201170 [Arthrobotrys entomopaga]|nr:hypothetical protein AA313_de0201170 [Arthrobotrys entomopaga]
MSNTTSVILFAVFAAFNFSITFALSYQKFQQIPTPLLALELIHDIIMEAMVLFTAFRILVLLNQVLAPANQVVVLANPVEYPPVNSSVNSAASHSNLSEKASRHSRILISSRHSGPLVPHPPAAISIPMEIFLRVDSDQLDANSAAGRAAGMEMLSPWSVYSLHGYDRLDRIVEEYRPDDDTMFDRTGEPDT